MEILVRNRNFFAVFFAKIKNVPIFAPFDSRIDAQMAESVDALVSNTSRFTPVPVRPRLWVLEEKFARTSLFFVLCGVVSAYYTTA